jgi:hypothetical protein
VAPDEITIQDEPTIMCFFGEIRDWPKKAKMAKILRNAGLNVYEGRYSIRIEDYPHFTIQNYGGDICEPSFDVDADTAEELSAYAKQISSILASANIAHRFEIYDDRQNLIAYYHHDWPQIIDHPGG